jgi:hypothetical protein
MAETAARTRRTEQSSTTQARVGDGPRLLVGVAVYDGVLGAYRRSARPASDSARCSSRAGMPAQAPGARTGFC